MKAMNTPSPASSGMTLVGNVRLSLASHLAGGVQRYLVSRPLAGAQDHVISNQRRK
jgi:hypothetical protein